MPFLNILSKWQIFPTPEFLPYSALSFSSGSCYPLTFDILIPQIVFYPLCSPELQCSIELAVMVETVYICAVQYGHHRPMWFLSTRNVAGEIEELYFELGLISIHWKVSSYMWPVAAVLNSTSLDYLFHENGEGLPKGNCEAVISPRNIHALGPSGLALRDLS